MQAPGRAPPNRSPFAFGRHHECQGGVAMLHDHHTHLFSPAAVERIRPHGAQFAPGTVDELVRLLDDDGVERALVLSVAYFFGMPDVGAADPRGMAAENDWVAAQVSGHPDRLAACCAVNPLMPQAAAEVERCAATGRFVGVKMHLANSDADLRNPDHVAAIADIVACANASGLAPVVHMRTRRADYGAVDAQAFIDRVLPEARDVGMQIAHVAGWGGYDNANDAALGAFARWAAGSGRAAARNVSFDIALARLDHRPEVPADLPADEVAARDAWHARRFDHLVGHVRAIGVDRFVFATDWPVATPRAYAQDLAAQVPFSPAELARIRGNVAPWLRRPASSDTP